MENEILVLTGLEETWGTDENIHFLGEWCLANAVYKLEHRNYKVLKFHWDEENKRESDYVYLNSLHSRVLAALTEFLNTYHRVNYDKRYWQILLDPWLLSFISVVYDRWESLRVFFDNRKPPVSIYFIDTKVEEVAYDYSEFHQMINTDDWNQSCYQKIILKYYSNHCLIQHLPSKSMEASMSGLSQSRWQNKIRNSLTKYFTKNTKNIFFNFNLNIILALRLCFFMGCWPFLKIDASRLRQSRLSEFRKEGINRKNFWIDFEVSSDFERYLIDHLIVSLPICLIEDYEVLNKYRLESYPQEVDTIFSEFSHWVDPFAKSWIAYQVQKGAKLIILEHGGAFPRFKSNFNFEENIGDMKFTWFAAHHPKHLQIKPFKYQFSNYSPRKILYKLTKKKSFCSMVGAEYTRWVNRIAYCPLSSQSITQYNETVKFFQLLAPEIKENFLVKPYMPSQGWSTFNLYLRDFGINKIAKVSTLDELIAISRLLVCTYPETTFSDCMMTNRPTILIYPDFLYKIHPSASTLLVQLKEAKIIFSDPEDAALHVNKVWANPSVWWDDNLTILARDAFKAVALGSRSVELENFLIKL